jgi:hypothetical protein
MHMAWSSHRWKSYTTCTTRSIISSHEYTFVESRRHQRRAVKSIFETLAHEMAHAIYSSFQCGSRTCRTADSHVNVLGQEGTDTAGCGKEMAEHNAGYDPELGRLLERFLRWR